MLKPGTYFSPKYDNMIVVIDDKGFPYPLNDTAKEEPKLIRHNLPAETLIAIWGPLEPVPVAGYNDTEDEAS